MPRIRTRGSLTAALVAAVAALVALLGITSSASAASIYACQKKKGGTIRIVSKKTKCKKTEKKLSWNTVGPVGPAGVGGVAGPAGATGATGATGAAGQPQTAITFDVTRDTGGAKTTLFTAAGVTVKLNCFFFVANFASIEVNGASGSFQAGMTVNDGAGAQGNIPQTLSRRGTLNGSDQTFGGPSSNTTGNLTNIGHVTGTVRSGTSVIFIDALAEAAPSPSACTVRGAAFVLTAS